MFVNQHRCYFSLCKVNVKVVKLGWHHHESIADRLGQCKPGAE